ncbi:MAG: bifunctional UDP-sugar hydrolase/5'-nucleotidase [Lachnospiraceae bacterium]|nr:bifunctional UDP-sugar hydrolase/5'-nucleotidase [Lachnospiraceae bacterium]
MKKRTLIPLALTLTILLFAGCGAKTSENTADADKADASAEVTAESEPEMATDDTNAEDDAPVVTIVYTNDVHCAIDNVLDKPEDAPEDEPAEPGLRLSKVAQYVNDLRAEDREVFLVDAGDEIQGSIYGGFDEGKSIISLMNAAGYQVATPGNHEFDYGLPVLAERRSEAAYPYISCNFHYTGEENGADPFEPYAIFEAGDVKVAFIGITTPEAITSSTPTYFQNENGDFIYTIDGIHDPADFYNCVQETIDAVKDEADYVIAIGHVGIDKQVVENGISSYDVIENTCGLDAFIDGHSHSIMEGTLVEDKEGHEVMLTQTGSKLANIGVMDIYKNGAVDTNLISELENADPDVAALEESIISAVQEKMGEQIAVLETELTINNPEDDSERLVRAQEVNAGDFVADAQYWYLNMEKELGCDISLANGGSVRSTVKAGKVTLGDVKNVSPFGNQICLIEATGQQVLDALEMGVTVVGEWDEVWEAPSENGGFMQVSGLRYTIDTAVPSSVKTDENGMFQSVDGDYRVKDVAVYNRETGDYEPLALDKSYRIGGASYILRSSGNGLSMFADCELVGDYIGEDSEVLAAYFESFTKDGEYAMVKTAGSPLLSYKGFDLDYENPAGSGRITILDS